MNKNKENWVSDFAFHELSDCKAAKAILDFVLDFDIRCGEYEGNSYVIKKLNREDCIIMLEHQYPNGNIDIPWVTEISKIALKDIIEKYI